MWWLAAAIGAALLSGVGAAQANAARGQPIVGAAEWAAAGCAAIAATIAAVVLWGRRDPLRLNACHLRDIASARRTLDWNPLAGTGKVPAPAAYLLEGIAACTALRTSQAWQLPGAEALRWRFDPDEEIFQITCAAYWMDRRGPDTQNDDRHAEYAAADPRGVAAQAERQYLASALLDRLTALHAVLATLNTLERRARHLDSPDVNDLTITGAVCSAQAENEMAADALSQLSTDMLAYADGYATLSAWNRLSR